MSDNFIEIHESNKWLDYQLLDSGEGYKLERFGQHIFIRPEPQAIWKRALPDKDWIHASAKFEPSGEESGGHWKYRKEVAERWEMTYGNLRFWVKPTAGRHMGVFPESASQWDWLGEVIHRRKLSMKSINDAEKINDKIKVINLFGYTGLATLAAAKAGAKVTHVDASRTSVGWARKNQELTGLDQDSIRWIIDDALKFIRREERRGVKYDGFILDPPKFGRGPKGEVWEIFKSLPGLLSACRSCMSALPLFVVLTMYAVRVSAVHLAQAILEMTEGMQGVIECGELGLREQSAGRILSQAVFARWHIQ